MARNSPGFSQFLALFWNLFLLFDPALGLIHLPEELPEPFGLLQLDLPPSCHVAQLLKALLQVADTVPDDLGITRLVPWEEQEEER